MAGPVKIRRRNAFNIIRESKKLSSFDELPMLRPEVDPQLHVSKNSVDQPFASQCEKDSVLMQVTGRSKIRFDEGPVRYFDAEPGDTVYVPAGYAHRIEVVSEGTMMRYKARDPGKEAVIFECEQCGTELHRHTADANAEPVQAVYQSACETFNGDSGLRQCSDCQHESAAIDLSQFRWADIAAGLAQD